MTKTPRVNGHHRGLRNAALIGAAAMSAAGLLLTGCGTPGLSSASSAGAPATGASSAGASSGGAHSAAPGGAAAAAPAPQKEPSGPVQSVTPAARLLLAQSIIYTASLTVQTGNVPAAVQRATAIVTALGGYTAAEQESSQPGQRQVSTASLQLKVPAPGYQAALGQLRTGLGTQTSLRQHAQDVTQQVADVGSRVTSAQAAIASCGRCWPGPARSASCCPSRTRSTARSRLEALQAQQRSLAHETSYATVSLCSSVTTRKSLIKSKRSSTDSPPAWPRLAGAGARPGLAAHRARTVLPFLMLVGLIGGIGYSGAASGAAPAPAGPPSRPRPTSRTRPGQLAARAGPARGQAGAGRCGVHQVGQPGEHVGVGVRQHAVAEIEDVSLGHPALADHRWPAPR